MEEKQPIDPEVKKAISRAVEAEPLACTLNMRLAELAAGYSRVEMHYAPESMANIYSRAHGGAIFSLIDEAFETASQTAGNIAVALNVNVAYVSSPASGTMLSAEAREISRSRKIANYDIRVTDSNRKLVATCQAVAYDTGKPLPF